MTRQPNRLPAGVKHGFGGTAIDRERPLSFRLNGRLHDGFAGDTVLSAVLAGGTDTAGQHLGQPVALDADCGPQVIAARDAANPALALPMDRTPALDGLDLVTVGPRLDPLPQRGLGARLVRLLAPRSRTLGHRLDDPRAVAGAWLTAPARETLSADTLVVGGGIAGMSAALAAAEAGQKVILIEHRPTLGGDARFYGTVGDETPPETTIADLVARLEASDAVTVLTGTDAMVLAGSRLRAHRVSVEDGRPRGQVLALQAPRIVLATGAAERLPVFPGNRLPGVIGSVEAFHNAERYGVWPGRLALFATPHNFGYRLALLAADVGIGVQRVTDTRPAPQSRFIDFCKASGITLAAGLVPRAVTAARGSLSVSFAVAIEDAGGEAGSVATDLLIAAGAWQPRLALWLLAGGQCSFDPAANWLAARGEVEGLVLAGSAAGWRSSTACLASGTAAVASLFGRRPKAIEEYEVDAVYESPPAPTPITPWQAGRGAFLDRGISFTQRPGEEIREALATQPGELGMLSLGDVAAFVETGAIRDEDAGIIAEERCLAGGDIVDTGWRVAAPAAGDADLPAFLHGRFGPKPQLALVAADDGRRFEVGCLVYPSSDASGPDEAIGVVISPAPDERKGARILASRTGLAQAPALFVRDTSGAVAATLIDRL